MTPRHLRKQILINNTVRRLRLEVLAKDRIRHELHEEKLRQAERLRKDRAKRTEESIRRAYNMEPLDDDIRKLGWME